jgi:hypothetical protein
MWSLLRQRSGQVDFQVLTAMIMKKSFIWVVAPWSQVEVESTSDTSVNFYHTTQSSNLEHSSLQASRHPHTTLCLAA